jgi:hypothetical protein
MFSILRRKDIPVLDDNPKRLQAQLQKVTAERDALKKEVERWRELGEPDYNADCLAVWMKSVDFLQDPRFMKAYRQGINSGHLFGRDTGTQDVHVEWRVMVGCWAASHGAQLEGDFVECGVNTGILSLAACSYIDFNATGKNFYLFDTYEGIPLDQLSEAEHKAGRGNDNKYYEDCWERAVKNFAPYPRAKLIRGKVPETLSQVNIEKACYLSIDMNVAYPERAAIEHFWDKLVPGAVILLDDYGWRPYRKQKETLDEFAAGKRVEILTLPTGQGLIIKP